MISYSPLRYPGGKGQMYKYVVNILEHNKLVGCTYIEPFCGGAGVAIRLLMEKKVRKIVLNDYDISIYCFWKAVLEYTDEFIDIVNDIVINYGEWQIQKEIQKNKGQIDCNNKSDVLTLGFSTFFLNRTNRSGIIKAGVIGGKNQDGNYLMDCRFNKAKLINLIRRISLLRSKIDLYNLDAREFIKTIETRKSKTFYFIDPPYFKKGKDLYTNFLQYDDHLEIYKDIRKTLKNKNWIITYDVCDEIEQIYCESDRIIKKLNYSMSKTKKADEYLFYNKIKLEKYDS